MQRVSPQKSLFRTVITLSLGLATVLFFQNCADVSESNVLSVTDIQNNNLQNLPFAYDVKIDQMSYMSCSGDKAKGDGRAYTLKAGAYSPGAGLRLKDNFLSLIKDYNSDVQARAFQISKRNDEAGLVMSVRARNDFQDYVDPTSNEGEIPATTMLYSPGNLFLSSEHMAKRLLALSSGQYLNYITGLGGHQSFKSMDGTFKVANNEGTEELMRSILKNSHYLTFTFPEPPGIQPVAEKPYLLSRSPYGSTSGDSRARTSVFGLGYALNFQQFDGRMSTTPPRVMTVSNAVNLEDSNILPEQWDCGERFVVVRPQDAGRLSYDRDPSVPDSATKTYSQVCDTSSDKVPANFNEQARWERIRNILPVEDWYVSLPKIRDPGQAISDTNFDKPGCIVPKLDDFCYDLSSINNGNPNPNIKIAYYYNENGDQINNSVNSITYNGTCGPGTFYVCPHMVTICRKL